MSELSSIESIVNPGSSIHTVEVKNNNEVVTSVSEGNQVFTTHNTVPEVQTIIQEDGTPLSTIVEGFWDVVWSVNGQTGDVILDVVMSDFIPHFTFQKNAVIHYMGKLYRAIDNITTGDEFDPEQWEELTAGSGYRPYTSLERLGSYIYRISFETIPEYDGETIIPAGCSSLVVDGKLHRNLDWYYDESPTFLVQCKGFMGTAINNVITDTNLPDEELAKLPYRMTDGINDYGIMTSAHVLYNDWDWHGSGTKTVPLATMTYHILTKVKSMETIEDDLADVIPNISVNATLEASEYLMQFVITDGTTTYVLTPPATSTGEYSLVDITDNPKLTNFRWVEHETVVRNADYMQDRPTGVERWNEMTEDFSQLRFTKAYEQPTRLSEFIGARETTKESTDEELMEIYEDAHAKYLERERDGSLWQTTHSVIYSKQGLEALYVQENWDRNYVAAASMGVSGFIAEYNVTPYQDVVKAIKSGETVFLHHPNGGVDEHGIYVPLTMYRANGVIFFGGVLSNGTYSCYKLTSTGWGTPANMDMFLTSSEQVLTEEQKATVRNNIGANGLPGGTTNQILMKASNADYDTKWGDVNSAEWGNITGNIADQSDLQDELDDKVDKVTGKALSTNDYTNADKQIVSKTDAITPAQASSSNQLADKAFVNSTVQTNTANFRGNWEDWADVPTNVNSYPQDYTGSRTPTVNDYLVVRDASDYSGETLEGTWRFKYNGVWATAGKNGWQPEYQVNETPLTAAQLAALNSGITASKVQDINRAAYIVNDVEVPSAEPHITGSMIAGNAITSTHIVNGAVTGAKIASGAVGESNIQNGAVTANKLADDSVTEDKIDDGAVSKAKLMWNEIMSFVYPVGSIYMSATLDTAAKVQTALGGGTWVAWGAGKVPVGVNSSETEFNTVEKTGGAKTHTHQYGLQYGGFYRDISIEQNNNAGLLNYSSSGSITLTGGGASAGSFTAPINGNTSQSSTDTSMGHYRMTANAQYQSSLQPYITCYMWKRTA